MTSGSEGLYARAVLEHSHTGNTNMERLDWKKIHEYREQVEEHIGQTAYATAECLSRASLKEDITIFAGVCPFNV